MAKKTAPLLPATDAMLRQFGERLRLARMRRRLSAKHVSERAGMAPMTLRSIERGGSGVTFGAYLAVMQVLGIERDLELLAQADPLGRQLQDARLPARAAQSAPAQAVPPNVSPRSERTSARAPQRSPEAKPGRRTSPRRRAWPEERGFSSSESLVNLLARGKRRVRKKS